MSATGDILTIEQREYVEGLRQLADFLETRPEMIAYGGVSIDHFVYSAQDLQEFSRLLGGHRQKAKAGDYLYHRRMFGPHRIDVNAPQQFVCEKRVVGTREVPAKLIEAHTEEIVEWVCPPTLADPRTVTA